MNLIFQRREARKIEQENNPYYMKSTSKSHKLNHNSLQVDEIPVAAIELNVPLKIPGN